MAATITPGLKRSAARIISARWLYGRSCHHRTGITSSRITSGNPALLKALREAYPLRRIQRCIAHKLRHAGLS